MTTSFVVKRMGPNDIGHLRSLNMMFAEVFQDQASYAAKPPSEAYFTSVLAKDHVVALAAFDGNDLIGGLVAYELAKLEQMRSEFYIYDLAVALSHRRKGVATSLIEGLREIAAKRGGWVIYVQADHGDDPAMKLYQKLGHSEDVMHFDIPV